MKRTNNEKGMSLIELLVVLVILGIISTIAVLGFNAIMQKSKDNAFVANAYSLKKAAENYYLSSGSFTDESSLPLEIRLGRLVEEGFIELFKDPDTREMIVAEDNDSFVRIEKSEQSLNYYVCYIGKERSLCKQEDGVLLGIPFEDLSVDFITN